MSMEKLRSNADRWYRQAVDDLDAAQTLVDAGKYPQGCFYAQQAGEKAMKALWFLHDLDPWGHSVARLIRDLPDDLKSDWMPLLEDALGLDKLYIPTRHPDALAELTPAEAYTRRESEVAIALARSIVAQVERVVRA